MQPGEFWLHASACRQLHPLNKVKESHVSYQQSRQMHVPRTLQVALLLEETRKGLDHGTLFTTPGFHLREKVSECGLKKVLMPGGAIIHPSNQFATVNTWHSKILHEDNFTNNLSLSKPWDIQCEPCCKGCIEHDCVYLQTQTHHP